MPVTERVIEVNESLHLVVGILIAFLGIGLSLIGTGVSLYYQGKSLEKPQNLAKISKQLHLQSRIWTIGGFIYIGMIFYALFRLYFSR